MRVVFHEAFQQVYASDPAAAPGRMEAVFEVLDSRVEWVVPEPAGETDIARVHTDSHVERVRREGV